MILRSLHMASQNCVAYCRLPSVSLHFVHGLIRQEWMIPKGGGMKKGILVILYPFSLVLRNCVAYCRLSSLILHIGLYGHCRLFLWPGRCLDFKVESHEKGYPCDLLFWLCFSPGQMPWTLRSKVGCHEKDTLVIFHVGYFCNRGKYLGLQGQMA